MYFSLLSDNHCKSIYHLNIFQIEFDQWLIVFLRIHITQIQLNLRVCIIFFIKLTNLLLKFVDLVNNQRSAFSLRFKESHVSIVEPIHNDELLHDSQVCSTDSNLN